MKIILSKKANVVLNEFDEAAQNYSWQMDQGTGNEVKKAIKEYNRAGEALEKYIQSLERKVKKSKK